MAAKDYSGTPLGKKLGAKPGAGVVVFFTTSRADLERHSPAAGPVTKGMAAIAAQV
jgi:hypothetical protein